MTENKDYNQSSNSAKSIYRLLFKLTPITLPLYIAVITLAVNSCNNYNNVKRTTELENSKFAFGIIQKGMELHDKELTKEYLQFAVDLGFLKDQKFQIEESIKKNEIPTYIERDQDFDDWRSVSTKHLGDINADGGLDMGHIISPTFLDQEDPVDCVGSCNPRIEFNSDIPMLELNGSFAMFDKGDDIDRDGANEIYTVEMGEVGSWGNFSVFSFKKGSWKRLYSQSCWTSDGQGRIRNRVYRDGDEFYYKYTGHKAINQTIEFVDSVERITW